MGTAAIDVVALNAAAIPTIQWLISIARYDGSAVDASIAAIVDIRASIT